jgi:mannose-6-phosphate isomerase-like protein (cupin superfamily)
MADYAAKRIDEMEAIYGGGFKRARAELGASSFGMQVIDMPPNAEMYPEHDHSEQGMEEIYVVLRGAGEIEVDGERVPIDPETIVRVGPGTKRKIWPGDQGIRVLALGGVPGRVYEPTPITELGGPESIAR